MNKSVVYYYCRNYIYYSCSRFLLRIRMLSMLKKIIVVIFIPLFLLGDNRNNAKVDYYLARGNYIQAIQLLKNINRENPNNSAYLLKLGTLYQSLNMPVKAEMILSNLINTSTTNRKIQFAYIQAAMGAEKYSNAISVLNQILESDKDNSLANQLMGEINFKQKKYSQSKQYYVTLLDYEIYKDKALSILGLCDYKLGNYEKARDYLEQAYNQNPANLQTSLLLSDIYILLENNRLAEKILRLERKKYPKNQEISYRLANLLYQRKKFNQAIKIYKSINSEGIPDWEKYQKMGICYYYLDKPKYADLMLKSAFKIDSTNYLTSYYHALTYMELEQYESAIRLFDKTIALSTPSFLAETYIRKAISAENLKRYNQSMKSYKMAIHFAPQRKDINYYIATLVDQFYNDNQLAIEKYEYFLNHSKGCDRRMIEYAAARVEELKEDMFFK